MGKYGKKKEEEEERRKEGIRTRQGFGELICGEIFGNVLCPNLCPSYIVFGCPPQNSPFIVIEIISINHNKTQNHMNTM